MSRLLPSKLSSHLLRLNLTYGKTGKLLERDLIGSSRFAVIEDVEEDGWNGGTYGHNVMLFLPLEELARVGLDEQAGIGKAICEDLNKLAASIDNEFYAAVHLEMDDDNDGVCQRAIPFSAKPIVNPNSVSFWQPGQVRLFISHRDEHKAGANQLAASLKSYGVSSFVAHDTIQAMKLWRHEILKGLETMEIMLIYLTDNFEDSMWCHQEVGYALGKGIPIVSLKLGRKDPPGFISEVQAERGDIDNPSASAPALYKVIAEALGSQERLQDGMVSAFLASESFDQARYRFERMKSSVDALTPKQIMQIVDGYSDNEYLHKAIYLNNQYNRLIDFMRKKTSQTWAIKNQSLFVVPEPNPFDDESPF